MAPDALERLPQPQLAPDAEGERLQLDESRQGRVAEQPSVQLQPPQLLGHDAPLGQRPDEQAAVQAPCEHEPLPQLRPEASGHGQPPLVVQTVLELAEEHGRLSTAFPTYPHGYPQRPTF